MPVSLTKLSGLVKENMRTLISATDAFQTFVGAGDAAAALASIGIDDELSLVRPYALVYLETPLKADSDAQGVVVEFNPFMTGVVTVRFSADISVVDPVGDISEGRKQFQEDVEDIIDDMVDLSGSDGFLVFVSTAAGSDQPSPANSEKDEGEPTTYYQWDWDFEL